MTTRKTMGVLHDKSLKDDENLSGSENNGVKKEARKKVKRPVTFVKSRYMQTSAVDKPPPKITTSKRTPKKVPKQSVLLETSVNSTGVFQSTVLAGHSARPEFDLSNIVERPSSPTPKVKDTEDSECEPSKECLELDTLLLTHATAQMEHNTHLMRMETEKELAAMAEIKRQLQAEVQEMKQQVFLREKRILLNSMLDSQIAALTPVAALASQFTQNYQQLATAVDATLHELPVKNLHIGDDPKEFLEKTVACLKRTEELLLPHLHADEPTSEATCGHLKHIKDTARELNQQLLRSGSDLQELSSLVSQLTVKRVLEMQTLPSL